MTVLSSVVAGKKELSTNNSRQPRTVIGPVREIQKFKMFENKELLKMFATKRY
jgi:hypothetical protein